MPVYVIDTLKPKNGLDFAVVEAVDVAVEGYNSLADAVTHFATDTAIEALTVALESKADASDLAITNAAVEAKADKTTTTDLQNQIDQIVISASSEGVVAPEVAAARVGADSTSYQTLKARLDTEFTETNDKIAATKDNLLSYCDDIYDYQQIPVSSKVDSYEMRTDGSAREDSDYELIRYSVTAGTKIKVNISGAVSGNGLWAFYSGLAALTANVVGSVHITDTDDIVTVPEGAIYLILSQLKNTTTNVVANIVTKVAIEANTRAAHEAETNKEISFINSQLSDICENVPISAGSKVESYEMRPDGSARENANYELLRYSVEEGKRLQVDISGAVSGNGLWAFYSDSGVVAANVVGEVHASDTDDLFFVPEGAKYLILSQLKNSTTNTVAYNVSPTDHIEHEIEELQSSIGNYSILTSSDFVNGMWESGTGFNYRTSSRITTKPVISVSVGDKISIETNGQYIAYQILESPDATTFLVQSSFSDEDKSFTVEVAGYLNVMVRKADNSNLKPSDLSAKITIDQTKFNDIEKEIDDLESQISSLTSNANVYNMRSAVHSKVICDCQSGYTWRSAITGNTATPDTEDYLSGSQSMYFTSGGYQTEIAETDLTNKTIVVKLKVDNIADIGTSINMLISDVSNMAGYYSLVLYKNSNSNVFSTGLWQDVAVNIPNSTHGSAVDLTKIKYIRFTISGTTAAFHVQSIAIRDKGDQKPCVSFTFDDGWSEVMTGAKILSKYNIPATAYVFENCQLTVEQLLSLKNDYNWDIECHHNVTMNNMTYEEIVAIIQRQQAFIRENNLGNAEHWAYAGGQNSVTLTNAMRRFCKSGRTISEETSKYEVIPAPLPYNLRAVSGVGASGNSVSNIKTYIDRTIANKGWLILVFHRIGDTQTSMFCSESDLEEIARYAVESGIDIKTVADMWERN